MAKLSVDFIKDKKYGTYNLVRTLALLIIIQYAKVKFDQFIK